MTNLNMRRILKTPTLRMQAGGEYDAANAAKLQSFAAANPGLGAVSAPAAPAGAGRGFINPAMATPGAGARPAPPPMLREGNSFGDAAAFSAPGRTPAAPAAGPQTNGEWHTAIESADRKAGMDKTNAGFMTGGPQLGSAPTPSSVSPPPIDQGAAMDKKVLAGSAAAPATKHVSRSTQAPAWTPMAMPTIGMKDGGSLRTGHGGHVPGTGQGDKIDAKYEPGEFVVSNDMLDAEPGLREQLHGLRGQVLAAQGTTPAQADAKAVSGGTLRAQSAFGGLFPYNQPEKDIYAGLGKPASAPENTPKPGVMLPPQQLQGATNGQSQRAVASAGPTGPGGATGGWGDAVGATGGGGGGANPGTPQHATRVFNAAKSELEDSLRAGRYAGAAGTAVRGALGTAVGLGVDTYDKFANSDFGGVARPAEDFGRAVLGMEDRKPGVVAPPTVKAAAPTAPTQTAQQLAAQAVAPNTTGVQAPVPTKLGDARDVDEYAGTMQVYTKGPGGDKAGWTTVSTPAAKQARTLRDQAYDQRLKDDYDRATTGPTGWKTLDAERQAREDAAQPMSKHKRAALTAKQGQETTLRAAMLQNQTSRDNNAATVQATREGNALSYSSSVENNQRTIEAAKLAAQREKLYKDRDFEAARKDKTLEQAQTADKAWTEHANTMFRTKDDKGNSVPDANKAAAYTQFVDQGIDFMARRLALHKDPDKRAYGERLARDGRAALDASDRAELPVLFGRQQAHAATAGSGPFSSGGAASMDPQDYRITGSDNGWFQERVKTQGKQTIPETNLRYGPDANRYLWNSGQGSTHLLPNKLRGE